MLHYHVTWQHICIPHCCTHYIATFGLHCWIHVADIDDCVNVTCQNDGVCLDRVNGYECNCTQRWRGDHCEKGQYIILDRRLL